MELKDKYASEIQALNEFLEKTKNLGDEGWFYLLNSADLMKPELNERREYMTSIVSDIVRDECVLLLEASRKLGW